MEDEEWKEYFKGEFKRSPFSVLKLAEIRRKKSVEIDLEEIKGHVEEFSDYELSDGQIRNALAMALKVADWEDNMSYTLMKRVIETVSGYHPNLHTGGRESLGQHMLLALEQQEYYGSRREGIIGLEVSSMAHSFEDEFANTLYHIPWHVSHDEWDSEKIEAQETIEYATQDSEFSVGLPCSTYVSSFNSESPSTSESNDLIGAFVGMLLEVEGLADKIVSALHRDGLNPVLIRIIIQLYVELFTDDLKREISSEVLAKAVISFRTQSALSTISRGNMRGAIKSNQTSGSQLELSLKSKDDLEAPSDINEESSNVEVEPLSDTGLLETKRTLSSSSSFHNLIQRISNFVSSTYGSQLRKLLD